MVIVFRLNWARARHLEPSIGQTPRALKEMPTIWEATCAAPRSQRRLRDNLVLCLGAPREAACHADKFRTVPTP